MNRNTDAHFSKLPNVKIQRSLFDRSTQNKLSLPIGKLVPIFADEYLPGDTFTLDTSIVIRTTSPFIKPVMDNIYADIYYFSVPNRLVWEHWKEFMGENTSGPWTQQTEYTIPQITAPNGGWLQATIADYFGIPIKVSGISISALWFRAYGLIWNEFFRDENLMNFTNVPKNDANTTGSNSNQLEYRAALGGYTLPVCKFHDYFTSALPAAQKGNPVTVNIAGEIPVYGNQNAIQLTTKTDNQNITRVVPVFATNTINKPQLASSAFEIGGNQTTPQYTPVPKGTTLASDGMGTVDTGDYLPLGLINKSQATTPEATGLYADGAQATSITINQLREAFALQKLLEKDARGGTRYTELIKAHFNVNSPDARLQRPEYLGGKRIPINIDQVIQMSGTEKSTGAQQTPQGNVSGYSLTADKSSSFTKSFTEHGMIIGLMCIRYEHTYQQGINRMFSRKRRYDYYWPTLANLGEQPIYEKEIKATGTTSTDDSVFGFQERWAEYRYKPSQICGQMRSNADNSLQVYHFADYYPNGAAYLPPSLGQSWIQEDPSNVDRTLSIDSQTYHPFIADIYFTYRCARPMPTYSVPGLIDHF